MGRLFITLALVSATQSLIPSPSARLCARHTSAGVVRMADDDEPEDPFDMGLLKYVACPLLCAASRPVLSLRCYDDAQDAAAYDSRAYALRGVPQAPAGTLAGPGEHGSL